MGFRARYRLKTAHPEIAAAFGSHMPEAERIMGQPSLDGLRELSLSRMASEGHGGELEATLNVKAVRGVIVEMSVTMANESGVPLSVCAWRAGQGISFTFLRRLN